MNQDDMILLGELMDTLGDHYLKDEKFADVIQKTMIISKQAKASKEYQEIMDKLNDELSGIGKDDNNG